MNPAHQLFAGALVEVMKNVCEQHVVVVLAKVRVKSASWLRVEAIADAGAVGILLCDFQDVRPVDRGDLRVGILPGHCDAVHTVASRNIEDSAGLSLGHPG